jgi:hypothetical protein
MTNVQVERGYLTQSLGNASHSGEHGLKTVPGLLKLVLEKEAWKERIIVQTGEEFPGFPDFEAYIKANPPRGLGIDNAETIDKLIGEDEDLRIKFYAALRRPHGGDHASKEAKSKINNVNLAKVPAGNSKAYALQKLSDEGQIDLLDQVKAGKLSANEAMKKAGFRRPKIAVSLDDPESAAKTLLTHASPEFLAELRRLLNS